MRFFWDNYFEKTQGAYPFFKYCPKKYRDYYVNLLASNCLGYEYNYLEPKTFNEKIRWLIYNENLELKTKLSDKILVKAYIASKLGKHKFSELYGTYNNFNEIDFSLLPEKFALKANHGWRMNILINNKNYIYRNKQQIKDVTEKWLKTNFDEYSVEPQYKNIKKRLLIERLNSDEIHLRKNLRLYCFNSKPLLIEQYYKKYDYSTILFFDTDWNIKNYTNLYDIYDNEIERPKDLDKIIEYSKILSKGFSFVRIDFAFDNDDIIVEEMTFTPYACKVPFLDRSIDLELGDLIELPNLKGSCNE